MIKSLFEKEKFISIFLWIFFSFSFFKAITVFSQLLGSELLINLLSFLIMSVLSFCYFFIYKYRFSNTLNFIQYIIYNIFFSFVFWILSFLYFKMIMLDNDSFYRGYHAAATIANLFLGSIFYPFTLIKKSEI